MSKQSTWEPWPGGCLLPAWGLGQWIVTGLCYDLPSWGLSQLLPKNTLFFQK